MEPAERKGKEVADLCLCFLNSIGKHCEGCYSAGRCSWTEACCLRSEGRMRHSNVCLLNTCLYFSSPELGLFKLRCPTRRTQVHTWRQTHTTGGGNVVPGGSGLVFTFLLLRDVRALPSLWSQEITGTRPEPAALPSPAVLCSGPVPRAVAWTRSNQQHKSYF